MFNPNPQIIMSFKGILVRLILIVIIPTILVAQAPLYSIEAFASSIPLESAQTIRADWDTKETIKRVTDLAVIFLTAPIWIPVSAMLCLAIFVEQVIDWDFGPFIIEEIRISQDAQFKMFKINMYRERIRKKFIVESPEFKKEATFNHLQSDKNNLRRVGPLMKKYYLDELGQVLNILRGEITLVGPRPVPLAQDLNHRPPRRLLRTGIFCFNGNQNKNKGDTHLKFSTDEEYLKKFKRSSPWELVKLDFLIMWDGVRSILKGYG